VASFFVSRVDVMIDPMLDKMAADESDPARKVKIQGLRGKAAIANARLAYQSFLKIFGDKRFTALKAKGARVQRPLWASTSVKDKAYSDLLYADALIGPDTVDTMPRETLEAFRDHGTVRDTLTEDIEGARAALAGLAEIGIDFKAITDKLEVEGVDKFVQSFDALLKGIVEKRAAMLARA
jgi:transaldolase